MDIIYNAGLAAAFIAAVLMVYGLYELFIGSESAEQRRLNKRLKQLRNTAKSADGISLLRSKKRRNERAIEKMIAQMPKYGSFTEYLAQAGYEIGPTAFIFNCLILVFITAFLAVVFGATLGAVIVIALLVGAIPFCQVWFRRDQRLKAIEKQLPDTVDLISRSMRAGHAFSPSLLMVADEMPDPISTEFRQISEEIAFGIPVDAALTSLARRLPLEDVRFFVIAVLLQRETGGNLAEILDNIGRLIRERFKLLGQVRVLTAEGRMSGWALSLMPFATAGMIYLVNRDFMSSLWQDPLGIQMLTIAGVMMLIGIFWMWRLVKIRV
ncbi:MAG: type II secretion system F family protein [Burkholderiaceae bacterium]